MIIDNTKLLTSRKVERKQKSLKMLLFLKVVYCCIGLFSFNILHSVNSFVVGSFPCGENCTCTNNSLYQTIAQCSNLKAIPLDLPSNITELDLSWNQITFRNVTEHDMCKIYTNMSKVSFAWNGITEMPSIFSGCLKLVELDLTGNKLKSVSSKTLQGLDKVKTIIGLEVEELQSDTFKGFFKLEILNLTFYGITMQSNVFTYLSGLKRLYVTLEKMMIPNEDIFYFNNGNSLKVLKLIFPRVKEMPASLLHELKDLEFLSLDAPSLPEFKLSKDSKPINLRELEILRVRKLDPDLLVELEFLETLKLHEISQVAKLNLNKVPLLKELEVVHCSFNSIPSQWLSNATALETLNLSDNELRNLDPKDFSNLKSLKHLVLSNNKLIKLPSFFLEPVKHSLLQLIIRNSELDTVEHDAISNLSLVEVIDLSFNYIDTIEDGNFMHLPQLKILNLKTNYISALKPSMFTTTPLLMELNLADNYFHHFPMEVIGTGVIELNLSGNRINTIPGEKLCGATTLRTLLLDDNPINCDCSLKELLICDLHIDIKGICNQPQSYTGIDISEFTGCPSITKKPLSTFSTMFESTTLTTREQLTKVKKKPMKVLEGDQSEIVRPIIWSQKTLGSDEAENDKQPKGSKIEQNEKFNQLQVSPDDMHHQAYEGNKSDASNEPGSNGEQGTISEEKKNVESVVAVSLESDKRETISEKNQNAVSDVAVSLESDQQGTVSEKKQNAESNDIKDLGSNELETTSGEKQNVESTKGPELNKVTNSEKQQNAESAAVKDLGSNEQGTNSEKTQHVESDAVKGIGSYELETNFEEKQKVESVAQSPQSNKKEETNSQKKQNIKSVTSSVSNEAQLIIAQNKKRVNSIEKQRSNSVKKQDSNTDEINSIGTNDMQPLKPVKTKNNQNISVSINQNHQQNVTSPLVLNDHANDIDDKKNMHQEIKSKLKMNNVDTFEKTVEKLDLNQDSRENQEVEQSKITSTGKFEPKPVDVTQTISTKVSMFSPAASNMVTSTESDLYFPPNSTNSTETVTFNNVGNSSNNTTGALFDNEIFNQSLDSVVAAHLEPAKGEDYKEMSPINSLISVLTIVAVLLASVGAIIWWYRKNWQSGSYDAVQNAGHDSMEHVNISMNIMNKRSS